jgi:hypothetical protein
MEDASHLGLEEVHVLRAKVAVAGHTYRKRDKAEPVRPVALSVVLHRFS